METLIPLTPVNGPYLSSNPDDVQLTELTFTASDPTNGNVVNMGNCDVLLMFSNTGLSSQTVYINSSDDPYRRSVDIEDFPMNPGATYARIFRSLGWEQSTGAGNLTFLTSSADIEVVAVPLG